MRRPGEERQTHPPESRAACGLRLAAARENFGKSGIGPETAWANGAATAAAVHLRAEKNSTVQRRSRRLTTTRSIRDGTGPGDAEAPATPAPRS
jgi:hypothetical protein